MSELLMRGHFRYLRFKTFPMTPRTPQCEVFYPLMLSSKHSGVPKDSQPPTFPNVGLHPHTWPKWGCDSNGLLKLKNMDWFIVYAFIYMHFFVLILFGIYYRDSIYDMLKQKRKMCKKRLWTFEWPKMSHIFRRPYHNHFWVHFNFNFFNMYIKRIV